MKLLHVIPRFIGGGPERHLLALADAWKRMGLATEHRIVVLDAPVSKRLLLEARSLGMLLFARPSDAVLDELIVAADVVDVTTWNHPLLLDALRRRWPPARIVLCTTVSGLHAPQVLFADLGRFADAVLTSSASSELTAALRVARALAKACRFVPALADMSRLAGFRQRPHDGIRVGYLGLIEPTKMHARFADMCAATRTPGLRFDVFGDGTGASGLAARCDALGIADRVRFHGHVDDLREAFAELDIFGYPLAPDSYATSEKALQEAMWAGMPPVVLAGTAAADLVEHERSGLVCADETAYSRAIDQLAGDPGLRERLGTGALEQAHARFDPIANALRIRELFEATAALPRRGREPLPGRETSAAARFVAQPRRSGRSSSSSAWKGKAVIAPMRLPRRKRRSQPRRRCWPGARAA